MCQICITRETTLFLYILRIIYILVHITAIFIFMAAIYIYIYTYIYIGTSPHSPGTSFINVDGIIRMHDAFSNPHNATVSVVLEYMPGGSLQDMVNQGGYDDELYIARIAKQLLVALDTIHSAGMIHRYLTTYI